jgi:hypothetical protein
MQYMQCYFFLLFCKRALNSIDKNASLFRQFCLDKQMKRKESERSHIEAMQIYAREASYSTSHKAMK